jgi:hypothetical protein
MKKVIIAFCLMMGLSVVVNAQVDTTSATQDKANTEMTHDNDYSDKVAIATTDLPALVREQLQGQDYSGWLVNKAYRKEKDGKTFYVVELKSGNETKMVKFDAQGNKVKEKDKTDK